MSARAFGDALRARQIDLMGRNGKGQKYRGPIRLKTELELAAWRAQSEARAGDASAASDLDESPFDD